MKIKIAISTNIKFYKISLPVLLKTLKECGINDKDIYVFNGGFNEEKIEIIDNIKYYFVRQNSYEYTPLIEIVEREIISDYWFLIHDTCKVGPEFNNLLYNNIPSYFPEKIAICNHPAMSIGLYKYDYLLSVKEKLIDIKNLDLSEESMIKWKIWGVPNEDYIMFKTYPEPLVIKDERQNLGYDNWYKTSTTRIVEYYPSFDIYKNKSNWGQEIGEKMIREL